MKTFVMPLALLACMSSYAQSGESRPHTSTEIVLAHGLIANNCGRFLSHVAKFNDSPQTVDSFGYAFQAFVSGYNLANFELQGVAKTLPPLDSYYWQVKRQCSETPQLSIVDVLGTLWNELPSASKKN